MYNKNNKGPKIDPWGTPLTILPQLEWGHLLLVTTL
jgi:hypothetical protein